MPSSPTHISWHERLWQVGAGIFSLALVFSVFAFGATTFDTKWFTHVLICTALTLLMANLAASGTLSRLFSSKLVFLWLPVLYLIAQGMWMVVNASSNPGPIPGTFDPLVPAISSELPGSKAQWVSKDTLWLQSGLLLVTWLLSIHCRYRPRLLTIARVIAGIGLLFALVGLGQEMLGLHSIYGLFEERHPVFFGPYRYSSNAGSFILMAAPFCFALLLRACTAERPIRREMAVWGLGSFLLAASLYINVSKAAQVIGTMTFIGFAFLNRHPIRRLIRRRHETRLDKWLRIGFIGTLLLVCILLGFQHSASRWKAFSTSRYWPPTNTLRWQAYVIEWEAVNDAGWLGHGPGTFRTLFPLYNQQAATPLRGGWYEAHQDYLQVLIEWGYAGAAAWATLIFGGLALCGKYLHQRPARDPTDRVYIYRAACTGLAGVALHAMVDFPMQVYSLQLLFMTLLAMAWSSRLANVPSPAPPTE